MDIELYIRMGIAERIYGASLWGPLYGSISFHSRALALMKPNANVIFIVRGWGVEEEEEEWKNELDQKPMRLIYI